MNPDLERDRRMLRQCRRNDILLVAETWLPVHYKRRFNVPYKLGGNSIRGIDCSHFVHQVYKKVVDPNLRYMFTGDLLVSRWFVRVAEPLPGDLVMWTRHGKVRGHVGIVVDPQAGTFIGAQKSTGVATSNYLRDKYWGRRAGRTFRRHVTLH